MTGRHMQRLTCSHCFELHIATPLRCCTLIKKFVCSLQFINVFNNLPIVTHAVGLPWVLECWQHYFKMFIRIKNWLKVTQFKICKETPLLKKNLKHSFLLKAREVLWGYLAAARLCAKKKKRQGGMVHQGTRKQWSFFSACFFYCWFAQNVI